MYNRSFKNALKRVNGHGQSTLALSGQLLGVSLTWHFDPRQLLASMNQTDNIQ
jgi:hypothetical protein